MSGGQYTYLFSPLQLGSVTVDNRVVFSAHLTNYASQDGKPSDQHVAYYEARAAGGAGLIITEEHSVHPTDWPYEKMIHAFHADVVPGYRKITEAVHRHGVPILAQINHNGGQASSMYTRLPVWAPSPVPDPLFREVPKAVEQHEIDEIVESYATVAARCIEGGFDGVELQCSHSSIVRGFLSRATNFRTDHYGGSLDNRARLLHEIVAAVRDRMGPGPVLGVRLCGDELIDNGTTIDDAVAIARQIEINGGVDYINTSIGVATASLFMIEASMHIPPEYAMFIPSAIRKAVDLPVIGVGRFKDPIQAERALADGHADLIGIVRGQIADPDFVKKAKAGRPEDTRLCLSCNQECVGRMGLNRWLGCIENPYTGREAVIGTPPDAVRLTATRNAGSGAGAGRDGDSQPARQPRLLVIGGGSAGLQAASSAAANGLAVTLLEASDKLGGQVRLAASVPNRAEFGDLVRNLSADCRRFGVDVQLNTEATIDSIRTLVAGDNVPTAVIVATGAVPARPYWAPPLDAGGAQIVDVLDVLAGRAEPAGSVLVIDDVGFHQATSVAELLADRGCEVEVVTKAMVVGQDLGVTLDMETWWVRATAKGIRQTTDLVPMGFEDGELNLLHHPTGGQESRRPDWIVLASPPQPLANLYFELSEQLPAVAVRRIGDCLAPRRAHSAVIEGRRVADELTTLLLSPTGTTSSAPLEVAQ
ncbi:MAG: FAD-dependent oxidoreductase [Acidimicrobiales bacterium]